MLTTTNVIVPGPWFLEAARLLKENPGLDVGVHLALTSEWDNVKWRPLSTVPSLVDADGYFFPMVQPRAGAAPGPASRKAAGTIAEVERELRAQLDMAKRHLPQATYTWNHMGFTSVSPDVAKLVLRLSKEYGLLVPSEIGVQMIGRVYEGKDPGAVKADKLAARLETLGTGPVGAHRSRRHRRSRRSGRSGIAGYEWVAADRSAEPRGLDQPESA